MIKKIIKWLFIMGSFVLIGLGISLLIAETFHRTGDVKFCSSCHVMEPMAETWKESIHGGKSETGVVAKCSTCHTDHSSMSAYSWTKVKAGIRDTFNYHFNTPDEDFFIEHLSLESKKKYVYESGCLSCHKALGDENSGMSDTAKMIHKNYFNSKETDNPLHCVTCHTGIAHPGLKEKLEENKAKKAEESTEIAE